MTYRQVNGGFECSREVGPSGSLNWGSEAAVPSDERLVSATNRVGELAEGSGRKGWHLDHNTKRVGVNLLDQAVVSKALDGLGQRRCGADRLAAAGPQAEFERQLDLADGDRATGIGEVAIQRSGQHGRGGTDQRPVDHREVVVQDRERGVSARGQGSESEARNGPRSLAGWLAPATGVLRAHGLPPGGR